MAFCLVNFEPFQPLQARIWNFVALPDKKAALTYSVPSCQTNPATKSGEPAKRVPCPPFSRNTPPGAGFGGSEPPSPSNTLPPPKANEVGVESPLATSLTGLPFVDVGGGGPAATAVAAATPDAASATPRDLTTRESIKPPVGIRTTAVRP